MNHPKLSFVGSLGLSWLQRCFSWKCSSDLKIPMPRHLILYYSRFLLIPSICLQSFIRLCILIFMFFFDSEKHILHKYRVLLCESESVNQIVSAKCPHQCSWFTTLSLRFPKLDCLQNFKNYLQILSDPYEHITILFSDQCFQCLLNRENLPMTSLSAGLSSHVSFWFCRIKVLPRMSAPCWLMGELSWKRSP